MLLTILLFVQFISVFAQNTFTCPQEWVSREGTCYRFVMYPLQNYLSAISKCEEDGASLLSVEGYTEHAFINRWLIDHDLNRYDWFTSGVVDTSVPGKFRWEGTGQRMEGDEYWISLEDRNKQGNNIIYKFKEIIGGYGWTRVSATDSLTLPYICEILEKESWRIKKENRDFTYGTAISDPNLAPRGPKFFKEPANTEILGYTNQVYFECLAYSLPSPLYAWFTSKNGSQETITYKTDKRYTVTSGRLSIQKPSERIDTGNYWCTAENAYGKVMSAPSFLSFAYLGEFSNVDTANVNPVEFQGTVILCPNIPYRSTGGIDYRWERGQQQIFTDINPHIFISGDGKLYFSEVTKADNGIYNCLANLIVQEGSQNYEGSTVTSGRVSKNITLAVRGEPSSNINAKIQDSFIQVFPRQPLVGHTITLECLAYGTPTLVYSWILPIANDERVVFTDFNRKLKIHNVRLEDAGRYTCVVNSRKTGSTDSKSFTLRVEAKPFFTSPLKDQHVDAGNQLTWRCEARGVPTPTYMWFKDGVMLQTAPDGSTTVSRNTITIPMLEAEKHNGMYQCFASNSYGVSISTAQLRVLAFKPSFVKNPLPTSILGTLRGNVTIICDPEAAPYPEYTWLRNNGNMNLRPGDTSSRTRMLPNGNLLITNVQQSDEGFYTCRVKNNIGQAESSTKLEILSGTTLQQRPVQRDAQVNSTAFIPCRASYNQELDLIYTWLLNENPIDFEKDTSYKMGEANTGGLYVRNVQYWHEGLYTCVAKTSVDEARGSAKLNVLGPPGQPVGVMLDKDPTIGARAVRVQWTDGSEHGDTIQFYLIQGKTEYNNKWEFLRSNIRRVDTAIPGNVNKRTALVQNLKPGVAYQFRVIAINSYGMGQPSFPSGWKQIQPARPIKAVSYVGGGGGKVGNLFIYWTPLPPEDLNGEDIGYLIKWRMTREIGEGESKWQEHRSYGNAGNFTTLVGANFFYLQYEVTVTAFNKNGTADAFTSALVYSAEDMPVGVPRNVYSKPFNSTALTVHWNPVPNNRDTMKGVLLGYKVNYWKRYGESELQAIQAIFDDGGGNRKSAVIIGLQPNIWYYVNVIAFNSAGNGPKSEKYPQQTDRASPQLYPTEVHVWSHGADSVYVTFRGVTSQKGEDPLRGYKIRYWELNENVRQAQDIDVEKLNYGTIYGLKDGMVYKLRVLGYSEGGDGKLSSPATLFTLGGQIPIDTTVTEIRAGAPRSTTISVLSLLICCLFTFIYSFKLFL